MSSIVRPQRRAIERVIDLTQNRILLLVPNQKYFLNNDEIFLRGISDGVGTCSDIHGIDVAVFGKNQNDYHLMTRMECRAAVFVRAMIDTDIDSTLKPLPNFEAVQGMIVDNLDLSSKRIWFRLSDRVGLYPPM